MANRLASNGKPTRNISETTVYLLLHKIKNIPPLLKLEQPTHKRYKRRATGKPPNKYYRHGERGRLSLGQLGCVYSASMLNLNIKPDDAHALIMHLVDIGLVKAKLAPYDERDPIIYKYRYTHLELTEKGEKYISIYEELLDMIEVKEKEETAAYLTTTTT